jgi:hypothetical protein
MLCKTITARIATILTAGGIALACGSTGSDSTPPADVVTDGAADGASGGAGGGAGARSAGGTGASAGAPPSQTSSLCSGLSASNLAELKGDEWATLCECARPRVTPGQYTCPDFTINVEDVDIEQCAQQMPLVYGSCDAPVDTYIECLSADVCTTPPECAAVAACAG